MQPVLMNPMGMMLQGTMPLGMAVADEGDETATVHTDTSRISSSPKAIVAEQPSREQGCGQHIYLYGLNNMTNQECEDAEPWKSKAARRKFKIECELNMRKRINFAQRQTYHPP